LEVTGWKTRIHGDLHLGQILEQPGREPVIVDWEGEPLRPLEERRRKELALRDVAGMWRSYAYAGAVFGAEAERVGELQRAFVQGWRECVALPGGDWLGVLEGMIWEKTIYEALYELRHRPGWLGVPVQALECPAGRGLAGLR
jgi:predicted trehalose synthase